MPPSDRTASAIELPPQYDPGATEPGIYRRWMDADVFRAHPERSAATGGTGTPFVITMPPPNVTGVLHMGHGLNNTIQDVLIRWRRMSGDEALWVPGTDHAGIATQNVVEKQLAREGQTRFDLGREAFVERVHRWVDETGGVILEQLKAIGASCDWSRLAYTLDPGPSQAVREVFATLYEDGLIYRGHRVIHWCSRCLTSLSDEEAEHADAAGKLYHIRYPLADGSGRALTVATTRPETMLGDVAVAVNPEDERYRDLIGRSVRLPIADLEIPIVADPYADPEFGTGVVKITPAHDPNDFEVGVRHDLPMPLIMAPDGTMRPWGEGAEGRVPDAVRGLDRFEARERIVAMLQERQLLEKVVPHQHSVRHCYRCNTVVEPRLSDQWFVRMEPLARPALEAVRTGRVRILPERWEAVYINWLENIRDWNISRQLWWGHRIPVWYCDGCGEMVVARQTPERCGRCEGPLRQDEDVLDTWFSSWLWPFSTLGWPDRDARDLAAFYPTDALVTASEILFFWVARMIMAGYHFMGDAPFHTVYITGTARDTNHVRMQKSLGNGIDPLDVVKLYGADALRYTVVAGQGLGADLILDPKDLERSFAPGRNFSTKLWNIGRFLLGNVGDDVVPPVDDLPPDALSLADRWILDRLDLAVSECDAALGAARPPEASGAAARWPAVMRNSGLRFNEYAESARRFVWNELAGWYVEAVKARLSTPGPDGDAARAVLVHAFDQALRLLHPIVPFITEALWQRLPIRRASEFLTTARWPARRAAAAGGDGFELVREAVIAIRQVRADYALPPGRELTALVVAPDDAARAVFDGESELIGRLARVRVEPVDRPPREAAAHAILPGGAEIVVPLAALVDLEKECTKLRAELTQLDTQLDALNARLANERFTARAPQHVVEAERRKQEEWSARKEQLAQKVRALCGA